MARCAIQARASRPLDGIPGRFIPSRGFVPISPVGVYDMVCEGGVGGRRSSDELPKRRRGVRSLQCAGNQQKTPRVFGKKLLSSRSARDKDAVCFTGSADFRLPEPSLTSIPHLPRSAIVARLAHLPIRTNPLSRDYRLEFERPIPSPGNSARFSPNSPHVFSGFMRTREIAPSESDPDRSPLTPPRRRFCSPLLGGVFNRPEGRR